MANNRPNLVFVFPDEFRQQAIGCMGEDPVITPNLDRFAIESLVLTDAVSPRPVCSPYRASLFTGKYPHAHGVLGNCNSDTAPYGNYLKPNERCLSDVLHDAGYSQGYVGKLHLDPPCEEHVTYTEGRRADGRLWDAYTPPGSRRHGFDFWYSYGCCDKHMTPHYWANDAPVDRRIDVNQWSVEHETDVAIRYLQNQNGAFRDPERPFSLFVSYNPPHMPFDQVPQRYVKRYQGWTSRQLLNRPNVRFEGQGEIARDQARNYFAAVTGVDEQFGRILDCLRDEKLEDNTIVVFTSDHGELMGSHGRIGKNLWYEESLTVPFIIRWPGRIQPGHDDLLLSTPDLMPTLLSLMGLRSQIPTAVQGSDHADVLRGMPAARPESALYLETLPQRPSEGRRGIRTHRYTFVIERDERGIEHFILFDNVKDPYQLRNVAAMQPLNVNQLFREMARWLAYTGDPWLS